MTSIIFPGQGSQYVGMVKDFYNSFPVAKETLDEIEDIVSFKLIDIIFNNTGDVLNMTKYTQIAIFAASMSIFKTLEKELKIDFNDINCMLGHSLGEYTALTCSKKINLNQASLILKKRGELMNDAVISNITGMAALIGKNVDEINKIIKSNNINIEIANDNSPIQVVVSGAMKDLQSSKSIFLDNGVKKFIPLNVSSAFHSNFMLNSQNELSSEIDLLKFNETKIKIISNYDANITEDNAQIINSLKKQMANRVRWVESIVNLEKLGEKKIIEIGPNKVLSGLIKRISNNFDIKSINTISDLDIISNEK